MTDKEIYKRAIFKAMSNGYKIRCCIGCTLNSYKSFNKYAGIIFSHSFAKAFFGTTKSISLEYKFDNGSEAKPTTYGTVIFNWEYHLMEMVRKENPIQYLKQFI